MKSQSLLFQASTSLLTVSLTFAMLTYFHTSLMFDKSGRQYNPEKKLARRARCRLSASFGLFRTLASVRERHVSQGPSINPFAIMSLHPDTL